VADTAGDAQASPLKVYCPECMEFTAIDVSTGVGRCGNADCPTPYSFRLAGPQEAAKRLYGSQSSWMPKF